MRRSRLVALTLFAVPCGAASGTDLVYTRWTSGTTGGVNRLNTETGEPTAIIPTGLRTAYRITTDPAESKIYWSSQISTGGPTGGGIRRSNLDGSNVELIVPFTGAPNFLATAFNSDNRKIIWSQNFLLRQSDPDGSNIQTLWSGASLIQDIAVDTEHDKIYISDFDGQSSGRLRRMNFDGTQVETILDQVVGGPIGLGIDSIHDRIYWAQFRFGAETGGISSANLDGTDVQPVVTGVDVDSLAVDAVDQTIYFTTANNTFTAGDIRRVNIDGSNPHTYDLGAFLPGGIALIPEPATIVVLVAALPLIRHAARRRAFTK